MRGGARFELHPSDRVQAEAWLTRDYEPALVEFIAGRLPDDGGSLFDVGAHVGLVCLQVAARRPGAAVHAFEPNAVSAARLRRNVALNPGLDVRVSEVAVGDRGREVQLAWAADETDLAGARVVGERPPGASVARLPMITLDAYAREHGIARVDVLKLDVEGGELAAIAGASALLSERAAGCVVCELNDVYLASQGLGRADVVERVEGLGYRQVPIPPVGAQRLRSARRPGAVVDVAFVADGWAA